MYTFDYQRPASSAAAASALQGADARFLAGGQSLIQAMKLRLSSSERLVDLGGVADLKGIKIDAEFAPFMLYVTNEDKPGHIGRLGSLLGDAGVNIATMALGRDHQGGDAISLVAVDGAIADDILARVRALPAVKQVALLAF